MVNNYKSTISKLMLTKPGYNGKAEVNHTSKGKRVAVFNFVSKGDDNTDNTTTHKQELAWESLQHLTTRLLHFGAVPVAVRRDFTANCSWSGRTSIPVLRGLIGGNELERLMNSTFVSWSNVCAHHGIPRDDWSLDDKYNVIRFKNGSTIDLLDVAISRRTHSTGALVRPPADCTVRTIDAAAGP